MKSRRKPFIPPSLGIEAAVILIRQFGRLVLLLALVLAVTGHQELSDRAIMLAILMFTFSTAKRL